MPMKSGGGDDPFTDDTTTEPPATTEAAQPPSTLAEDIIRAFDDQGKYPQISLRTSQYVALLDALEERSELEAVAERLAEHLGTGVGDVSRSRLVELAIGVGLETGAPDVVDALREAKAEAAKRDL